MTKIGSVVQWQGKSEKLTGKVIAESGQRWKIESGGKSYFVPKDKVKRGYNKKKKAEPKKTPAPDKELLQKVMGVMAEVAKEKGKSTKKEVDSKVAMDKKVREGKLKYKEFFDEMFGSSGREAAGQHILEFERDMAESQGYNMDYWFSRVTKKDVDSWEDLTDKQQERLQDIMAKDLSKQTEKKMKAFYNKFVKGKKFKSIKEIRDLLKKEYDEVTYKH